MVFSRNAHGHINTGVGLLRCTETTVRFLERLLEIKETHKNDWRVVLWDHNGAVIIAVDDKKDTAVTLISPKIFNACPLHSPFNKTKVIACPERTCHEGWWAPGDFIAHFYGGAKGLMAPFLEAFPPHTWPNWTDVYEMPRKHKPPPKFRRASGRPLV